MLSNMQIKGNIGYHQTIGDNPQYLVFLQDIILSFEVERNLKLYFTIKFYCLQRGYRERGLEETETDYGGRLKNCSVEWHSLAGWLQTHYQEMVISMNREKASNRISEGRHYSWVLLWLLNLEPNLIKPPLTPKRSYWSNPKCLETSYTLRGQGKGEGEVKFSMTSGNSGVVSRIRGLYCEVTEEDRRTKSMESTERTSQRNKEGRWGVTMIKEPNRIRERSRTFLWRKGK